MNIPIESLKELRRICAESFQRQLTDVELQEIAQRIIRFLKHSEGQVPDAADRVDAF